MIDQVYQAGLTVISGRANQVNQVCLTRHIRFV